MYMTPSTVILHFRRVTGAFQRRQPRATRKKGRRSMAGEARREERRRGEEEKRRKGEERRKGERERERVEGGRSEKSKAVNGASKE